MNRRPIFPVAAVLAAVASSGCSLTPEYGCRAPDGVTCMSASEVYDRDGRGEAIRPKVAEASKNGEDLPPLPAAPRGYSGPVAAKPGDPIYREPHRLRIWVVDWEDATGVYHPNNYKFVRVDNGEWVLPLMRERLLENTDGYAE